ncbi:MAG: TMEM175 family protein [Chitinophagales bacterium]|nr:DUF1211 domain-containing protein [Bacteroidota bacterium]MBX7141469.1 TMEM175 family protein [Chitinophagales bacterium]
MNRNRLEAFSDGVIAIIITIMVLELKVPHGNEWKDLWKLFHVFEGYVLSFVFIAIYWVNHHHLIHAAHRVTGYILWANIHLLFWLSLIPFATAWMGENNFEGAPVATYAVVLILCGFAYNILQRLIAADIADDSPYHLAMKKQNVKGIFSLVGYSLAAAVAMFMPVISEILFVLIAVMWFLPDRNIERATHKE